MSDTPKRPVETPQVWFRYAEEDLAVADREIKCLEPACRTVAFLCQSAAEKFLKGYLIAQGWRLQRTHDIVTLLGFCTGYDPRWATLASDGVLLNEYIVAGRYPSEATLDEVGRREAQAAITAARRIQAMIMDLSAHRTPAEL